MRGEKRLRTMLCVPGKNYPSPNKQIIAKVTDGKRTRFFTFGPHVTYKRILYSLPMIWQDRRFDERRKERKQNKTA